MEVNAAVATLKEAMEALQTNADDSRGNMLKLNLREAEEALSRCAGSGAGHCTSVACIVAVGHRRSGASTPSSSTGGGRRVPGQGVGPCY